MFEHFSFACPSRQRAFYGPYPMHDTVSPTSSRESTPCCDSDYSSSSQRGYSITTSIAELSHHFDRHTLTPRRPSICPEESTPRARELNPPLRSPTSFSNRLYRRQSLNRLQCSSDHHLSRISALVDEMVQTGQPVYRPTHPTALLDDSSSPSLSPDEIPPMASPMASYFDIPPSRLSSSVRPSSSFSANCDPRLSQLSLRHPHSYKTEKESRYLASRDGIRKPMIKKKIRMRKSLKMSEAGAKRDEK